MAKRAPSKAAAQRRWVVGAATIGWILIVVVGAGAPTDDSLLGAENLDVVWAILLGAAAVLSLAFIIYLNPFRGEWTQPEKSRRGYGFWIFIAIVGLLWVWRPGFLTQLADDDALANLGEAFDTDVDTTQDEAAPETVAQLTDLLLIAVVVALLGCVWYVVYRRSSKDIPVGEASHLELEADLAEALEQASHELAITGDPRTAVLRSYAVLETVLATHGSSRTKSDTPTEHLRRALQNLRVESAPLLELGRLYELARFSDHTVSATQQAEAARALGRARTSLARHP